MSVICGIKFKAYPNKKQRDLIDRTFGCCRFVYNRALAYRQDWYKSHPDEKMKINDTYRELTKWKKEESLLFLNDVDSQALQQSIRDLDKAYRNFFAGRAKFPKFHKKSYAASYRTPAGLGKVKIIDKHHIKLPKVGTIKVRGSRECCGKLLSATVSRTSSGEYFISITCDGFEPQQYNNDRGSIGIDVGIKNFYTDSNGNIIKNPKFLETSERKLKREQRRLSRKKRGSANYYKQKNKLANTHEKIANQRNDFLHVTSSQLVHDNKIICCEDLNISGMMKNHGLAKSIASVSWYSFLLMLDYKLQWHGGTLIKIQRFYPSSQICHCCGKQFQITKDLSVRKWVCPNCGTELDRDVNAAINILQKGLQNTNK